MFTINRLFFTTRVFPKQGFNLILVYSLLFKFLFPPLYLIATFIEELIKRMFNNEVV